MRPTGGVVGWLAKIGPATYRDKIIIGKGGEGALCAKAKEAICGCARSACLPCLKLKGGPLKWGFGGGPCGLCTANRVLGEHQCTTQWRVGGLKCSCRSRKALGLATKELKGVLASVWL